MHFRMRRKHGPADPDRSVERDAAFADALQIAAPQMKIICEKGLCAHVYGTELAEDLRVRGHSAVRFAGGAKLYQRRADGSPDGTLDEGQPLVANQHCAR